MSDSDQIGIQLLKKCLEMFEIVIHTVMYGIVNQSIVMPR